MGYKKASSFKMKYNKSSFPFKKSPVKSLKKVEEWGKNVGEKLGEAAKTETGQNVLGGLASHLGKRIIDRIIPAR